MAAIFSDNIFSYIPDSKVHGANMGPIWSRRDPGGHHVGPMNFAIWDYLNWSFVFRPNSTEVCSYVSLPEALQTTIIDVICGGHLGVGSANQRRCYYETPSFIGGAHSESDPWIWC